MVLRDVGDSLPALKTQADEGVGQSAGRLGERSDGQDAAGSRLFRRSFATRSPLDLAHELNHRLGGRRPAVCHVGQTCPNVIGMVAKDNPPSTTMV